jgi:hypothetical protein
MNRGTRLTLVIAAAVLTGACASSEEWAHWRDNRAHFASEQHAWFSVRNQREQKRVTRADVEVARQESWWGRAVTVQSDQILER